MTKSHCAGLLLLMLLPLVVQGQASIVVEPGDKTLVIKGWVGDDASFIGNIGVTVQGAQGSNPIKLNIYRTDLKTADGRQTILRQSVSVTGEQTLTPDATSIYQVKVTGVREAGEYRGTIFLSLAGQQRDAAVAAMAPLGITRETLTDRLRSAMALLVGISDEVRTEAIFFLVRPILWLALLLGLLAVGLKTLYVDNLVFGANAFTDFLGLMFWGLSADVASRTISSLRISNASRPAGG